MKAAKLAAIAIVAIATGTACSAVLGITDIEPPAPDASDASGALDAGGDTSTEPTADAGGDVSDAAIDWMACLADGDLNNDCYLCEDQQCCGPELACQNSSACGTYETCLKKCEQESNSSSQCTLQCAAQNQSGHAIFAPLLACGTYHCFAPCGKAQGDPCQACLQSSCADPAYACGSDPDCDILAACNESCADAGSGIQNCMNICQNNAPAAAQQLYQTLQQCQTGYCSASCAGGG
jgi:hypothetical protein